MKKICKNDMLPLKNFEITSNDDPTLETISLTFFVSGCPRRCKECQNPSLQTVDLSTLVHLSEVKQIIKNKTDLISSVCFCGGDFIPYYTDQLKNLVTFCKQNNLRTILYTGEVYEKIETWFHHNIDIIIDGPFDTMKKQNIFPASSNQRVWINGIQVNTKNLKINQ